MQANLWEARSSREGAEETARQGNVGFNTNVQLCMTHCVADDSGFYSGDDHFCRFLRY